MGGWIEPQQPGPGQQFHHLRHQPGLDSRHLVSTTLALADGRCAACAAALAEQRSRCRLTASSSRAKLHGTDRLAAARRTRVSPLLPPPPTAAIR